ncbi:hypothetical protein HCH_06650 [Hahella chejuensis KCTC 2396]|uniref:Uncharacterized protein n=1 Tax=Hahella chejuensis (strain KCTC 2396) TaxID=349521 RepID=Q2S7U1_HAHCH|nr:hypothetical protein HCH_06650 [Hahella chejuensis KCTC 2396]
MQDFTENLNDLMFQVIQAIRCTYVSDFMSSYRVYAGL